MLLLLIIMVINIITLNTIEVLLSDIMRLVFIVLYYSLFNHTTTINEMLYGIEAIVDPLELKRNRHVILYISLVTRFPSIFKKNINKITRVLKERKVIGRGNIKAIFDYYKNILVKSFNSSIEELNDMIYIMKTRLYGYGKSRTNYRLNKISIKEALLLVLNVIILIIVIIY